MKYLLVFIAVAVLDVIWAQYTLAVQKKQARRAAFLSSVLYGLSAVVVLEYTHEPSVLLAAMAGAYVGTLIGVLADG